MEKMSFASLVLVAVCSMQAAMAGGADNANNSAKPSAMDAATPLTDAEIEQAALAGWVVIDNHGLGVIIRENNGSGKGASFVRENPANGATVCKNNNCAAGN